MFTVKHVEANGYESIHVAKTLSYDPTKNVLYAFGAQQEHVTSATPVLGGGLAFGNGIVFVMNDAGQTVSKYDLDKMACQSSGPR